MSNSYQEKTLYENNSVGVYSNLDSKDLISYSSSLNETSNAVTSGSSYVAYASGSNYALNSNNTTNQVINDILQLSNLNSETSNIISTYNNTVSSTIGQNGYLSEIEQSILRSNAPININESEEITVLGQRGLWANKQEVINWRGLIPISEYLINEDQNPEIITKRTEQNLTYIQELAIRYLRPPTPPAPGEIIIQQQANLAIPPAPPLIIRQQPARPSTPEPLVVREAPPQPPAQVGRKVITISGKRLPPPPRKVVIERLAPLPSKPQSVIVERWLPYSQVKRRVIYQKSNGLDPVVVKPRNIIVQWEAPQVQIKKDYKYLGVVRANPVEYVQRYGSTLKTSRELPEFVLDIKTPPGIILAADYQYNQVHELEGEIQALKLIDLDREGLGQYRSQLEKLGIRNSGNLSLSQISNSSMNVKSNLSAAITEIFSQIDKDSNGRISESEAEKLLLRLNSRLGQRYGEDDAKNLFKALDKNRDGFISLNEFKKAFENLF